MFGKKPAEISHNVAAPSAKTAPFLMPSIQEGHAGGMDRISYGDPRLNTFDYQEVRRRLMEEILDQIDVQVFETLPMETKRRWIYELSDRILLKINIPLNDAQLTLVRKETADEIVGFGPIEPLLADPDVNDIMINTAQTIFIERFGKIYLTDIRFLSEAHLLGVVQRIVSRVGRRIDESNPMVDARMPDGSRFNAIVPPLALDGCLVSIRKFKKHKMRLSDYVDYHSLSEPMCRFLAIAAAMRLNIIISGGTGSGKTTLLNALSGHIDVGERIITIEDAAELQLHQPHVLRLESRPASTEGKGEISQRDLMRNALRMRPDRIILGEMRGEEIIDMLTAMNTGHDGSMGTIHANSPRDCLARIENLVAMSSVQVNSLSLRQQMANAVQMIIQIQRMRDGTRRITHIEEIRGFDGQTILTQPLFTYHLQSVNAEGAMQGVFVPHEPSASLLARSEYFGQEAAMLACFAKGSDA